MVLPQQKREYNWNVVIIGKHFSVSYPIPKIAFKPAVLEAALCVPFLQPKTSTRQITTTSHLSPGSCTCYRLRWHFTKHGTPITRPVLGHSRTATRGYRDQIVTQQPGHGLSPGQHKVGRWQPLRLGHTRRVRVLGHKVNARLGQLHVELVQARVQHQLLSTFLARATLLQTRAALPIRRVLIDQG